MTNIDARLTRLEQQFDGFFEKLDRYGLEFFRKYYGIYRGTVKRNDDPDKRGRIQAVVYDAGHTDGNFPRLWIDPIFASAGTDHGSFCPPEIGDSVRVVFSTGKVGTPIGYFGGWYGLDELPEEFSYSGNNLPDRRGFVTRMGHSVTFSDAPGDERITINWHKADGSDSAVSDRTKTADRSKGQTASLSFNPDGSFNVSDAAGNTIKMGGGNGTVTLSGNFIVNANNLALGNGASFSVPLGELLIELYNSHVHPTSSGPSGPPIPSLTSNILSGSVKISS